MDTNKRWEMIYNKINGFIEPDVCPWVRDESSMVLIKLAAYYNTSIDYLLGLTDIKEPYPKSKR